METNHHAAQCDPKIAREALRAYLSAVPKKDRRRIAGSYPPHSTTTFYVALTEDDGGIIYTCWQLHALAGDLLGTYTARAGLSEALLSSALLEALKALANAQRERTPEVERAFDVIRQAEEAARD